MKFEVLTAVTVKRTIVGVVFPFRLVVIQSPAEKPDDF